MCYQHATQGVADEGYMRCRPLPADGICVDSMTWLCPVTAKPPLSGGRMRLTDGGWFLATAALLGGLMLCIGVRLCLQDAQRRSPKRFISLPAGRQRTKTAPSRQRKAGSSLNRSRGVSMQSLWAGFRRRTRTGHTRLASNIDAEEGKQKLGESSESDSSVEGDGAHRLQETCPMTPTRDAARHVVSVAMHSTKVDTAIEKRGGDTNIAPDVEKNNKDSSEDSSDESSGGSSQDSSGDSSTDSPDSGEEDSSSTSEDGDEVIKQQGAQQGQGTKRRSGVQESSSDEESSDEESSSGEQSSSEKSSSEKSSSEQSSDDKSSGEQSSEEDSSEEGSSQESSEESDKDSDEGNDAESDDEHEGEVNENSVEVLRCGSRVKLVGLKSQSILNGTEGTVVGNVNAEGRFPVSVPGIPEPMSLRESNLQAAKGHSRTPRQVTRS